MRKKMIPRIAKNLGIFKFEFRQIAVILLQLILLLIYAPSSTQAEYTYTTLLPPDWIRAYARDINDSGSVVGYGYDGVHDHIGFLYSGGEYTDFLPFEWTESLGLGINDSGYIVGDGLDGTAWKGFLYDGETYTELLPPGTTEAHARDINNSEVVVGYSNVGYFAARGFLYNDGTYAELLPPNFASSYAMGINNSGAVVGYGHFSNILKGFLYSGGTYTELLPPFCTMAIAEDINDFGIVAGNCCYVYCTVLDRGFLYDGETYTELLPPGWTWAYATGINNNGAVVGYGYNGTTVKGFHYSGGIYTELLPPTAGSSQAYAINSGGVITGEASDLGFIATPLSNQPPDGTIDTPSGAISIFIGEKVNFTGTGIDPDNNLPLSYYWSFGEGSGTPYSQIEDPGDVKFNNPGIYTVTFTVSDSSGLSDPTPSMLQVTVKLFPKTDPGKQTEALELLKHESRIAPILRAERGIPRFLELQVFLPATLQDDPVVKAFYFLDRYKALFRLYDPLRELHLNRIGFDKDTVQHLFFGQHRDNIPVFASELSLHILGNEVLSTGGNYLAEIPWFPPPKIGASEAEDIAMHNAPGSDLKIYGETRLMYFNEGLISGRDAETHLAWRVMVHGVRNSGGGITWMYFIDAHSGSILLTLDSLRDVCEKEIGIETANHDFSDTCWVWSTANDFWCTAKGCCGAGYPYCGDLDQCSIDKDAFCDGWDAGRGDEQGLAWFVWDYYYDNFGRCSFDDDEGLLDVYVHEGQEWGDPNYEANASWRPECDDIEFTDGMVALDVFGHEFTHGVTASTADLVCCP